MEGNPYNCGFTRTRRPRNMQEVFFSGQQKLNNLIDISVSIYKKLHVKISSTHLISNDRFILFPLDRHISFLPRISADLQI